MFLLLASVSITASLQAEMMVFLNVPGAKGSVTEPAFKDWLHLSACRYRLPGVPAPEKILISPPAQSRGMFIEKDLKNNIGSFSKPAEKSDKVLNNGWKKKTNYPIWEMAVCTPDQQVVMNILFKGVTIKGISQREGKVYVTFSFQRAVWKYNPPRKTTPKTPKS